MGQSSSKKDGEKKKPVSTKVLPEVVSALLREHTPLLSCFCEPEYSKQDIEEACLRISSLFVRINCKKGSIFNGGRVPRRSLIFVEKGDCYLVKNSADTLLPAPKPGERRVTLIQSKPCLRKILVHDVAGMTELVRGVDEVVNKNSEFPTDILAGGKCTLLMISADVFDKEIRAKAGNDKVLKTFADHLDSMTSDGVVRWLKNIEFLSGLTPQHFALLSRIAHFESFHARTPILQQGCSTCINSLRTNRFYVVLSGELEVSIARNGVEKIVGNLSAGEFFGESTLLSDNGTKDEVATDYKPFTASASVTTQGQTLLIYFDPNEFREACVFMPEIAVKIYEYIRIRYAGQLHSLNLPIFSGLDREELRVFTHSFVVCKYEENSVLFEKDAIGDEFYILLHGTIRVEVDENTVVTLDGKGDYFGELALIRSAPRSATARAGTNALCAVVAGKKFRETLLQSPVVAAEFELRALRERASVAALLLHPLTHDHFRAFLDAEFASENYKFCDAVRDFKHSLERAMQLTAEASEVNLKSAFANQVAADQSKGVMQRAQWIYDTYVKSGAESQVNLSSKVVKRLDRIFGGDLSTLKVTVFDDAMVTLEASLKGNLGRFVATQHFKDALETVGAYKTREQNIVSKLPEKARNYLHPPPTIDSSKQLLIDQRAKELHVKEASAPCAPATSPAPSSVVPAS